MIRMMVVHVVVVVEYVFFLVLEVTSGTTSCIPYFMYRETEPEFNDENYTGLLQEARDCFQQLDVSGDKEWESKFADIRSSKKSVMFGDPTNTLHRSLW